MEIQGISALVGEQAAKSINTQPEKVVDINTQNSFDALLKSPASDPNSALNLLNDFNNSTIKVSFMVKIVDQAVVGTNKLLNMS
jgi:hypothetical protein